MRLFEAILEANHRAVAGDKDAGLHPDDFAAELPVVALTCIDPRLNPLLPAVLGVPAEQFISLRNAGNIITGPLSSTMRSLALACAVKGGREIAVIGHTDCQVCKTSTIALLEKFKQLGVERHLLPDNLNEYFGMFSSERQNVIKACDFIRSSPLIGPQVPVHGLIVDIETGKLEWLVNGYEKWQGMEGKWNAAVQSAEGTVDQLKALADFKIGDLKFPETKIGETITKAGDWLKTNVEKLEIKPESAVTPPPVGMQGISQPQTPPAPPTTVTSVAEKIVDFAAAHWPQPEGQPPPLPPKKTPLPPPLRPRPVLTRRK